MILELQKTRPTADVCQIGFSGKLMMGSDSKQVERSVAELLAAGVKKIIFDLSNLDTIDSTGVGILVVCEGKVRKAGGKLRIAGPGGVVKETLVLTHVDRLVPIYSTVIEATQNFNVA